MENENRKYTLLSFLSFSALTGYILYLLLTQIADYLKLGGGRAFLGLPWPVVGGTLAGVLAVILLVVLVTNQKALQFFDEVFIEVQKCTWPDLQSTLRSTLVVSVLVGIAAVLLFVIDYIWGSVFRYLL